MASLLRAVPLLVLLALAASYPVPVPAQQRQPTESQCREMVNGMVQTMKSAPIESERDKRDARKVIERVEKVVKDNRARGASECESWAAIGKIVTTQ